MLAFAMIMSTRPIEHNVYSQKNKIFSLFPRVTSHKYHYYRSHCNDRPMVSRNYACHVSEAKIHVRLSITMSFIRLDSDNVFSKIFSQQRL